MGGSSSKEKSRSYDLTPVEFRGLRGGVADTLGAYTNYAKKNIGASLMNNFQAGPAAQLTGGEQSALQGLNRGVQFNPLANQALNAQLDPRFLDVGSDPNIQGAIDAATRPVFEGVSQAGRDATAAFANAGQSPGQSSPFAREAGRIQQQGLRAAGDISSQIVGGELQRRQALQSQAIGQAQQQQAFQLQQQLENLQAQGLPRLVQELGIQRGIDEFNRQQTQILQGLELATSAASPTVATKSDASKSGGGLLTGG